MTYVHADSLSRCRIAEGRIRPWRRAFRLPGAAGKSQLLIVTNRERSSWPRMCRPGGWISALLGEGVVGFWWRDTRSLRDSIAADVRAVASDSAMTARLRTLGSPCGPERRQVAATSRRSAPGSQRSCGRKPAN